MVMVSHLDDDHANGILALTEEIIQRKADSKQPVFDLNNLWVNTFDDIVGNIEIPFISNIAASTKPADIGQLNLGLPNLDHSIAAVIASTGQGRQLRNNAEQLALTVNNPFSAIKKGKAKLVRGKDVKSIVKWDKGLKINVVQPNTQRLIELQKKGDEDLKLAKKKGDNSVILASLGDTDTSPFNLSSIVCLVEFGGKKILLTGDARSDDVLEGLRINKLLDTNGGLHVDILKMPHHGSERNSSENFLEKVTADHYVISANGKFNNPDTSTIEKIAAVNKDKKGKTLHLTNHDGQLNLKSKLDSMLKKMTKEGNKLSINFRTESVKSIIINLLDRIDF